MLAHCKTLRDQFTGIGKGAKYLVQSIEKMKRKGTTKRGAMDPFFTQNRKVNETEWIKTLRTAYPYEK